MSTDVTRRPADLQLKQPAQVATTPTRDMPARTKSVFAPDSGGSGPGILLILPALAVAFVLIILLTRVL